MAERRSEDPQGADFSKHRRWHAASLLARRNWLGVLVLALSILTTVTVIKLLTNQIEYQRDTLYDNRLTQNQGCVRGNEARRAQVDDILDTRQGNLARARAWHHLIDQGTLPPVITAFAREQERANRGEAEAKLQNAAAITDAQASVAAHPHAKSLIRRADVDCNATYPLPMNRGDPLPRPTLPVAS